MLFASIGTGKIVLILVAIAMLWALGRYGRDTRIGFGGVILLGLFLTPLIAFIIIYYLITCKIKKTGLAEIYIKN
ncbi:hypothetical protein WAE58_07760 [Pedobacter panaciterrae]|jgi:hypothetical protein|uniref:Uncharacterized protein n=1 Tax=Pedobacter panaciterrae TaxID=363849 RepID=A0ABU8NJD0_9SPHI|nr:hypothetical protein [Pedobacter panaciterrae]NQX55946.1 hypothetical protein [Pedobacter panaciterrae]